MASTASEAASTSSRDHAAGGSNPALGSVSMDIDDLTLVHQTFAQSAPLAPPRPACGERSDREAIRVRGRFRKSELGGPPPHPDLLPASGEKETAEFAARPSQTTK